MVVCIVLVVVSSVAINDFGRDSTELLLSPRSPLILITPSIRSDLKKNKFIAPHLLTGLSVLLLYLHVSCPCSRHQTHSVLWYIVGPTKIEIKLYNRNYITLQRTFPVMSPIGQGPYVLESVELLKLSPCNQTCPSGIFLFIVSECTWGYASLTVICCISQFGVSSSISDGSTITVSPGYRNVNKFIIRILSIPILISAYKQTFLG